jgi:glycosyltransferase involved in cell wall biosynthesis
MADALHPSDNDVRKVLMLAYVFPPFFSVGGSIRVVKFIKYLPALGWLPVVLTIDDSREYDTQRRQGSEALQQEISQRVKIYRTGSGEPSVELLEKGREARRQNRLMAVIVNLLSAARRWASVYLLLPDENITWLPFALQLGCQVVRKEGIDAIFATCPPHSVALISALLKRLTRKPLVLDFRDDWIDTPWHRSKPWLVRRMERWLERWAVKTASRVILVTEWSRTAFVARYPREPEDKFVFIPNGCDLEDFAFLKEAPKRPRDSHFTIVHAGLLVETEHWNRSPQAFFQALCNLRRQYPEMATNLTAAFTGRLPNAYRRMAEDMGLSDVVKEMGHLPRDEFIRLMHEAHLLLTINYDGFATLVPGKIYEYWAVGGPPILLLSCRGAAQDLVEQHELGITAPPYDVAAIQRAVLDVYRRNEMGDPMRVNTAGVEEHDRRHLTEELADALEALSGQ